MGIFCLNAWMCHTSGQEVEFAHSENAERIDPHPNTAGDSEIPPDGGIGYTWTVEMGSGEQAFVSGHVGAWSWQDEALFDSSAGEEPVGWTHTSNWLFLNLKQDAWVTLRHQKLDGVPWPSAEDPLRKASTDAMNPSFTIFAGYDGDGGDAHTWNNDGNIEWAEDLTYLDHVNNTTASVVQKSWFLPAGSYTIGLGSNAPSNDTRRQGYMASLTTSSEQPTPQLRADLRNNQLTLVWPHGLSGYMLQHSPTIDFSNASNLMEITETVPSYTVPEITTQGFFHIRKINP
ncbi:MAG: hypothetical protein LR011_14395 [Verrucomicrobia bacterium]|nr:hypothetical protein [Verrucomicrobiota bacterium]